MAGHGTFYWNELMTRDPKKARDFYGPMLGWTFDVMPMANGMSYYVCKQAGKPVAGICAEAVPQAPPGIVSLLSPGVPTGVTVAAGGGYRIADLQPGRYKVRFAAGCDASGYATRWYKNARTSQGATVVRVSAAKVTTGIDATLPRG